MWSREFYPLADGNQNSPNYVQPTKISYMYEKLEIMIPNQILVYFRFQELPIVSCVYVYHVLHEYCGCGFILRKF